MDIQQHVDGDVTIVALHEKLDTGTAPDAGQALSALVEQGSRRIVVDFTDVAYVSSAGLRVLLATAKQLRAKGGALRVCSLNEGIQEVFDISGFSTLLSVYPCATDAVRGF